MRICKYCNKPIEGESVFNPDKNGNGYHHSCLCELEFRTRDKQIYDKGRADVLEQIREEIEREADHYDAYVDQDIAKGLYYAGEIMDKYMKGESNG